MLQRKRTTKLSGQEREAMRRAGRFNAQLLDYVRPFIGTGVSTGEIDRLVHEYTVERGHTPAPLNYMGFPKSCCTSINSVVCHGIPGDRVLKSGDLVNLDVTSIVDGWYGDQSETFLIGEVSEKTRALVQCTLDCLYLGIRASRPGGTVADIGAAILKEATARSFSVVREYVGHGIGNEFHKRPNIPHAPTAQSRKDRLTPGMCFTIEPMINVGGRETVLDDGDGWTVTTRDGSLSAQFEHTILMTEEGPEILTLTSDGPQEGHIF